MLAQSHRSLVEGNEGLYLPNSKTNVVIVHSELYLSAFELTSWTNTSLYHFPIKGLWQNRFNS